MDCGKQGGHGSHGIRLSGQLKTAWSSSSRDRLHDGQESRIAGARVGLGKMIAGQRTPSRWLLRMLSNFHYPEHDSGPACTTEPVEDYVMVSLGQSEIGEAEVYKFSLIVRLASMPSALRE
jgi:hypothetical protein